MDLLATAVMPAGLLATYYMILNAIFAVQYTTDNITAIILVSVMGLVLFLPAFLVLLTGSRLSYIGWMGIYLLALPIWQFVLPLYAFWHFDDFSWGDTRKVVGDVKGDIHADDYEYMSSIVPFKRWDEYEREKRQFHMAMARRSFQGNGYLKVKANQVRRASLSSVGLPSPNIKHL